MCGAKRSRQAKCPRRWRCRGTRSPRSSGGRRCCLIRRTRFATGGGSIHPSLDALRGISHRDDPLRDYLMEMRDYMPPAHRGFIEQLETSASVRQYVIAGGSSDATLRDVYNRCVKLVEMFRQKHLEYA